MFYIDAHNPYKPPEPWRSRFDPEWEGEPISNWKHEWRRPDPKRLRNLVAQYDGGIAYWDEEFSKLVRELKARGRFDNALIVYTSDHGWSAFPWSCLFQYRSGFRRFLECPGPSMPSSPA
jgi:arylsulfatase A-like enzyme